MSSAMRANPGGTLEPKEILGRDRLVRELWRTLERQSVVLTSERRMGKTSVVTKTRADAPEGWTCIYRDLEGLRTPAELAGKVAADVHTHLTGHKRQAARLRKLLKHLGGVEIGGVVKLPPHVAPHWKQVLGDAISDLAEQQESRVVLFWDELPLMLHDIRAETEPGDAMEILDLLRSLRQTHANLRMVYTGSVGLHHVIGALREAGYANDPTNDMCAVDVPPLTPGEGAWLAASLIRGEEIPTADPEGLAHTIATAVDGVPYYIHHVVDRLAQRDRGVAVADVEAVVNQALVEAHDPWHLRHYRERVETYYGEAATPIILALLDTLAQAEASVSLPELMKVVPARVVVRDPEALRAHLVALQNDHYIVLEPGGGYGFRLPLLRRWWLTQRGLGA